VCGSCAGRHLLLVIGHWLVLLEPVSVATSREQSQVCVLWLEDEQGCGPKRQAGSIELWEAWPAGDELANWRSVLTVMPQDLRPLQSGAGTVFCAKLLGH
jgi:hypothetical protein